MAAPSDNGLPFQEGLRKRLQDLFPHIGDLEKRAEDALAEATKSGKIEKMLAFQYAMQTLGQMTELTSASLSTLNQMIMGMLRNLKS